MASDPVLLDRIRNLLTIRSIEWSEKKMFGGQCFLVDDKMCFGTYQGGLMVRINPDEMDQLTGNGAEVMIHGGRPMKGFLLVQPEAYEQDNQLQFWIDKCLAFNPQARSSKPKR